jgi:oligoribonuclease NrnB/cAMP/cGMP phosphodiesterase (DHH superfamily)
MKTAVLYHNDADGFGAAFAAWFAFGGDAMYIPVQYGEPFPDLPTTVTSVFIVDFSYKREEMLKIIDRFEQVLVLDHHKTAEQELAGLPNCVLNLDKSGCHLAWDEFCLGPQPPILAYVEDRDLWRFALPNSKEVNLFISTLPENFEAWNTFNLIEAEYGGKAIKAFQDAQIRRKVDKAYRVNFPANPEATAHYSAIGCNATENISELGNELCKAYPDAAFSATFWVDDDGDKIYSLRSIGDFDVSAVAKAFGGGGHKNAAGFKLKGDLK